MKLTLYMAISVDGYIAGLDDDTDWVKDTDILEEIIAEKKVSIYGRRTYDECVKYEAFPYPKALNIVMTSDKNLLAKGETKEYLFTDKSAKEVVELVKSKGFKQALLVGGGKINASFLEAGLIDEMILSVHPLVLGDGIKLFGATSTQANLEFTGGKQMPAGLFQLQYKVLK